MQLRFSLPVPKLGAFFKQSTSAILTGVTIAGAFSTVIFNSTTARGKVSESFETFASLLAKTPIYSGIKNLGGTFKNWGTVLVSKKDDFVQWVDDYLNVSGFKSGAVELYQKLKDWAEIVYDWFRYKFLIFISRIPEMVKNWKQLRLSLFKWGTFLGGGGGAALWAMFGSFDDIGKLADLMGNEDFMAAAEKFAELVGDNPDAFKDMGKEDMQQILERLAEDPETAKEIIEELQKEQEEMAEKEKKEKPASEKEPKEKESEQEKEESEEKPQLSKERIKEAFSQNKGSPQKPDQVFGHLAGRMLKEISGLSNESSFLGEVNPKVVQVKAKKAMEAYFADIEKEQDKTTKAGKSYKEFLEALGKEGKNTLIEKLPELAEKAYWIFKRNKAPLNKAFEDVIESELTEVIPEGQEGEGVDVKQALQIPDLEKIKA